MPPRRDLLKLLGCAPFAALPAAAAEIPNAVLSEKNPRLTREPFGDLSTAVLFLQVEGVAQR